MKTIGLTGGIGSGKSTVTKYLQTLGYDVLDADEIARNLVHPFSETLKQLAEHFGQDILLDDGSLNRKKLADLVFSDPDKRAAMNKIMHDKIIGQILERLDQYKVLEQEAYNDQGYLNPKGERIVFLDAPLLYEFELDAYMDRVWVVVTDEKTRIRRIRNRDGITEEEIMKRIGSQMPETEKIKKADDVLNNSGTMENLYKQIDKLLASL